jgi:hypothetical protein
VRRVWRVAAAGRALLRFLRYACHRLEVRFSRRNHRVGEGADAFFAGDRAPIVNDVLADLEERLGPDDTLLVLSVGVMINYLARRVNPTSYIDFMPPEFIIFGEAEILEAFRANPPDYVALVHRETGEYGYRFFGRGYGRRLFSCVMNHDRPVRLFGEQPLQEGTEFGIEILQRRGGG